MSVVRSNLWTTSLFLVPFLIATSEGNRTFMGLAILIALSAWVTHFRFPKIRYNQQGFQIRQSFSFSYSTYTWLDIKLIDVRTGAIEFVMLSGASYTFYGGLDSKHLENFFKQIPSIEAKIQSDFSLSTYRILQLIGNLTLVPLIILVSLGYLIGWFQ